jgi:ComF family protein
MPFFTRLLQTVPFECAICAAWPSSSFEGVTGVCQTCIRKHAKAPLFATPIGLDDCATAVDFDTPWSALISRYKFAPEPGLARLFAGLMLRDERIQALIARSDIIIPLPLSAERLEERGFNQALLLAKHLARDTFKQKLNLHTLIKTRDTTPQRTLGQAARQQNIANAFALQANTDVAFKGKHVLLIDDVTTTGATLVAAAEPLRRAGAASVSAVVIAYTPRNSTSELPPHPYAP